MESGIRRRVPLFQRAKSLRPEKFFVSSPCHRRSLPRIHRPSPACACNMPRPSRLLHTFAHHEHQNSRGINKIGFVRKRFSMRRQQAPFRTLWHTASRSAPPASLQPPPSQLRRTAQIGFLRRLHIPAHFRTPRNRKIQQNQHNGLRSQSFVSAHGGVKK